MKTPKDRLDYIYKWIDNNKDKFKATQKKYAQSHREQINIRQRKAYAQNKEKILADIRERRKTDPEYRQKRIDLCKKWKRAHPDKIKESNLKSSRLAYEKNRDAMLEKMHNRLVDKRKEVIYWYSNGTSECAMCGETNYKYLVLDHINDDGYLDRKKFKGNVILYIIKNGFPSGFQVLCHNCNTIKQKNRITRSNPNASYNTYRDKVRREMIKKYSRGTSKCMICGNSDNRCLQFHHVNGGGGKHIRSMSNKSLAEFLYKNSPSLEEYSVLCANCNASISHHAKYS